MLVARASAALVLTVAALALAAPAHASIDPTGPFTFTETTVEWKLNPSGPIITCSTASFAGSATGAATVPITAVFSGCTWPITCSSSSGSFTLTPITGTVATAVLSMSAGSCTATAPGCVITLGAFSAVGTQLEGSPGSTTVPVTGNTDAIPFTSSGFSCGFASIPPSGTMTFSQAGGPLTFVQTAGADLSWT